MREGDERKTLRLRIPVSDDYWSEYGRILALLLVALAVVAVAFAGEPGEGLVAGAAFLGLSTAAVVTGLVAYNLAVAAMLAGKR